MSKAPAMERAAEAARSKASSHGPHRKGEAHHGHSHGPCSEHEGGHHLLQVEGLSVSFRRYAEGQGALGTRREAREVLHDLSLAVHHGELVAVVGASGAGKTVLADGLLGLFEPNATVSGRIWFEGREQDAASLARLRGSGIALVPQSVGALDPLMRVGRQVQGAPSGHGTARRKGRAARRKRQEELFARHGLDASVGRLYPFQLSGGMARRVLLCCALMGSPRLLVADEPTPGLDLELAIGALEDLRRFADEGGGVLLITHDVELALRVADRVAVFLDGTIVEEAPVESFAAPELLAHPFSRALWHALPANGLAGGDRPC